MTTTNSVKFGNYSDFHIIRTVKEVYNIIETYTYPDSVDILSTLPSLKELQKTRKYILVVSKLLQYTNMSENTKKNTNLKFIIIYCVFRMARVTFSDVMMRMGTTSQRNVDIGREELIKKCEAFKEKKGIDFFPVIDSRLDCPSLGEYLDLEKLDIFAILYSGNLKKIKQSFIEGEQTPKLRRFFSSCLKNGELEVAKLLLQRVLFEQKFLEALFEAAVKEEKIEIVKMFLSTSFRPSEKIIEKAMTNLRFYEALSQAGYDTLSLREAAMACAVNIGDVQFIKYVFEEECTSRLDWDKILKNANGFISGYVSAFLKIVN